MPPCIKDWGGIATRRPWVTTARDRAGLTSGGVRPSASCGCYGCMAGVWLEGNRTFPQPPPVMDRTDCLVMAATLDT